MAISHPPGDANVPPVSPMMTSATTIAEADAGECGECVGDPRLGRVTRASPSRDRMVRPLRTLGPAKLLGWCHGGTLTTQDKSISRRGSEIPYSTPE